MTKVIGKNVALSLITLDEDMHHANELLLACFPGKHTEIMMNVINRPIPQSGVFQIFSYSIHVEGLPFMLSSSCPKVVAQDVMKAMRITTVQQYINLKKHQSK